MGKDTGSKASSVGERFGVDARRSSTDPTSLVGKAAEKGSDLKEEAKMATSRIVSTNTTSMQRRQYRGNLMSPREMTTDFLENYSFEIKTENGEPEGLDRFWG